MGPNPIASAMLSDLLIVAGVAGALYGAWLLAPPLALIVGGLLAIAWGWTLYRAGRRR